MHVTIEWDENKNSINKRKHGISFEEAQTVFVDEKALLIHDPDHSDKEDRFILMGVSAKLRILVVCHCYRTTNETIRIISARKANRTEQKKYWKEWKT
ncbi:MAG: BrnT family toxin [Candidatus Schekmanbacteria bacterium]|nr:BrnT family toxin [Candidatus Schekmanbacteria bacterium]